MNYEYKGQIYKFVEEGLMKHPTTREWVDAVFYRLTVGNKTGPALFGREKVDFYKKFKLVTPKIPYHIEVMANFFGVIKDQENVATGEIRKFIVPPKTMKKGQRITSTEYIKDEEYCATWTYIAGGYFKQIGLWKTESHYVPAI